MVSCPTDASVHQLCRAAGILPPQRVRWIRHESSFQPGFASVVDAAQMDGMIRFCRRYPQCIACCEVSAELSKYVPASRSQPLASADDVLRIAATAALPDPLSLQYQQKNGTDNFVLRYIVPGRCEALISHCHANAVYWRDDVSWRLNCQCVD
jgi:hypothetical protein